MGNSQASKTIKEWKAVKTEKRLVRMPFGIIFMWFILVATMFLFLVGIVNQMNVIYKYTYLEPYSSPGKLTSNRYGPIWWTEMLSMMGRLLVICMSLGRLIEYKNPWIVNFHMITVSLYFVMEFINLVFIGLEIGSCNGASAHNNQCNDYRWCGVYGINSTACPKNYCSASIANPTVFPYVPPVDPEDLTWNAEFAVSFYTSLLLTMMAVALVPLSYVTRNPRLSVITPTAEEEEADDEVFEEVDAVEDLTKVSSKMNFLAQKRW